MIQTASKEQLKAVNDVAASVDSIHVTAGGTVAGRKQDKVGFEGQKP